MEVSKIVPRKRIVLVLSLAITALMAMAFAGSALAQDAGTPEDPAVTDPALQDPATTDATEPDPVRVFRDGLTGNPANTAPDESFDRGTTCDPTITFGVDVYWFNDSGTTTPVDLNVNQGDGSDPNSYNPHTTNVAGTSFSPASPVSVPLSGAINDQKPDPAKPHADVQVTHDLPAPGPTATTYYYRVHIDGGAQIGNHNHYYSVTVNSSAICSPSSAALHVKKFYDANANGTKEASESYITGWKVAVDGNPGLTSLTIDPIAIGDHTVTEADPVQSNWSHTTPTSVNVTLANGDDKTVEFGNVCVGAGGGLTLGFWSNNNGKALFNQGTDLALMVSLNLRNANGSAFDPANYNAFRTWLLSANAVNMSYMLSAQLAAMELNVLNGKVNGNALIYAPGTTSANANGFATVSAVMAEADAALGADGLTPDGDPNRSYQEALKNALDKANNNLTFVQSSPCAFSFPV